MSKKNRKEFSPVNTNYSGCVDGRLPIFVLHYNKKTKNHELTFNAENLKNHNYPQILGAALGFVAAVEVNIPGSSMKYAFDLVEAAFVQAGYKPSIHVDDKHGSLKSKIDELYSAGKEEELVELILKLIEGCGFAKYQWNDNATNYILEAIRRGWVIQVLTGDHQESFGGAHENHVAGTSFDVVAANQEEKPAFNQDYWFARLILEHMEQLTSEENLDFANSSIAWLQQTYVAVVIALGGVSDVSQIKKNVPS